MSVKKPKATQAQKISRVQAVQSLLLKGRTRSYIVSYGAKVWGLADRQMDQYIQDATLEINEANKNTADENLALITSNLWKLFRRATSKKEYGTARGLLMDIAKLRGLDQIDVNLQVDRPLKDTSEEDLIAAAGGLK